MRCPKCRFMVADKRDICPGCYLDLRPEKKRVGLDISAPAAPYEQLVEDLKASLASERPKKLKQKRKKKAKKVARSSWFTGLFSGLFTKKTKATAVAEDVIKVTPETAPEKTPPPVEAEQPASPPSENKQVAAPSVDDLAFESLFDAPPADLGTPPEIPEEIRAEQEILRQLEAAADNREALELTEALRALPSATYCPLSPQVIPEVVEFHEDDDELLEQQLNAMLGDETLEIEAVKQESSTPPMPASLMVDDDLEISFEFDLEESVEEEIVVVEQEPPAELTPSRSLNELELAINSLERELNFEPEKIEILRDELPVKRRERPKFSGELRGDPTALSKALLEHLAEIYHCDPDDLFEGSDYSLEALERELDAELEALGEEGFSIQQVEEAEESFFDEDIGSGFIVSPDEPAEVEDESNIGVRMNPDPSTPAESLLGEGIGSGFIVSPDEPAEVEDESNIGVRMNPDPSTPAESLLGEGIGSGFILTPDEPVEDEDLAKSNIRVRINPDPVADTESLTVLFDLAEQELSTDESEIELSEIVRQVDTERTLLLFDTAQQAMIDASIDHSFTRDLRVSINREIETEKIQEVFERYAEQAWEEHETKELKRLYGEEVLEEPLPENTKERAPLWQQALWFCKALTFAWTGATVLYPLLELSSAQRDFIFNEGTTGLLLICGATAWKIPLFAFVILYLQIGLKNIGEREILSSI